MDEQFNGVVHNLETGEVEQYTLTPEEIAEREAATAIWEEQQAELAAEDEAKETAKAASLAKLEALGLTAEDIQAILG